MLALENSEEMLEMLDHFTKQKPKEIPHVLNEYIQYVAKTGDTVYNWSSIQYLFREKLLSVIKDFHDTTSSVEELPQCPNVDQFNYEAMKTLLFSRFDRFQAAPFTIQRLSELLVHPKKHYTRLDKFMRALEKNILVVSTVEPGRPPVDLEENGEENGSISTELNIDAELSKSLEKIDGEAANGITNNGNVDIEGIDENASSSTASHTIKDVEHNNTDANNDDANNDTSTEAENNAVSSEEKQPIKGADEAANYLCNQVCYETISNDSADNTELDLSLGLNKGADNDGISSNNAEKVEDIIDVGVKKDETNNGNELENDDEKKKDKGEEKPEDDTEQVLPVPVEEISSANESELVNESTNNNADPINKQSDTDTPKKDDDLAIESIEASNDSESGENSAEAAPSFDEIPAEKDVALPAETADAEKAALGESSELEHAAEPTVEASSPTKEEAASKKPLTPKRSHDNESDEHGAKKAKSDADDKPLEKQDELQGADSVKQQSTAESEDKTDWETASLEEYIPPHIREAHDKAAVDAASYSADAAPSSADTSCNDSVTIAAPEASESKAEEVVSDEVAVPSSAKIDASVSSILVDDIKPNEAALADESNVVQPSAENIDNKMNEDTTPTPNGDEMNVEETDGNAMDAAPIKADEEQMDIDDANSSEAMDL